ncbi:MAG: DNA repair exonuclease [Candidatus Hydrogenedentes bacterium]|nr:DNA repair exonuclease [Candidatus Hydrogenedentota bacterium]
MVKFIHAADIHLDSPLRGLERYEGAPVDEIRQATRRALENMVKLAIKDRVDFVLLAGDIYDGDWRDHNTGLFFAKQMSVLRTKNIQVFLIAGNHDAKNVMSKHLRLPDNVHYFETAKPETVHLEKLGVAIHGQGFSTKAVTKNLSKDYPAATPDMFNIGLLHTSMTGREGHDSYAPCTTENLINLGYDYWALGHVHARECVNDQPPVWFAGNLQGRHIRETGPKGCLIVTVEESSDPSVQFQALDVIRWENIVIDVSDAHTLEDCLDSFKEKITGILERGENLMSAVRVRIEGKSIAHEALAAQVENFQENIRAIANDYGEGRMWVEKVKIRTQPCESEFPAHNTDDAMGELSSIIESLATDETARIKLLEELEPLTAKLPADFWKDKENRQLVDSSTLLTAVQQAYPMLAARLRKSEEVT